MNPYISLKRRCVAWATSVQFPRERTSFQLTKQQAEDRVAYRLDVVRERVITADLLGWDTVLKVNKDGDLLFVHRQRHDDPPWEIR